MQIPRLVLHALDRADVEPAPDWPGFELTPYLLGPECRSLWKMRSAQITETPEDHPWITRLIVDTASDVAVGLAGFHGAPDDRGMVEIGYRIDPAQRRRGYARAALQILLDTAANDTRVGVIRATVSPDNRPSRALLDQYGFQEVGEQWDDEDGLETILEVAGKCVTTPGLDEGTISTSRERIDVDLVHRWLSTDAYWALERSREVVERAVQNSLNFGIYLEDGSQIAYARVVTDLSTFAWLCDVYVDPAYRGRGAGTRLAEVVREELAPYELKRILLSTNDAHDVYARAGFVPIADPSNMMILRPS